MSAGVPDDPDANVLDKARKALAVLTPTINEFCRKSRQHPEHDALRLLLLAVWDLDGAPRPREILEQAMELISPKAPSNSRQRHQTKKDEERELFMLIATVKLAAEKTAKSKLNSEARAKLVRNEEIVQATLAWKAVGKGAYKSCWRYHGANRTTWGPGKEVLTAKQLDDIWKEEKRKARKKKG